jgi:NAD-dependent SIR2 family protein deacetylase
VLFRDFSSEHHWQGSNSCLQQGVYTALDTLKASDGLLVIGSSLVVYSAFTYSLGRLISLACLDDIQRLFLSAQPGENSF